EEMNARKLCQKPLSCRERIKRLTRNQNVLCNSSGAGSVPPRPIEIKLLKSPRTNAVQRSCNWLSALSNEVGRVISSAPKSSAGAVMFTVPFVVPVAVIELPELKKKSETSVML